MNPSSASARSPLLNSKTFLRAFLKVSRQLNFSRDEREMFLNLLLVKKGA